MRRTQRGKDQAYSLLLTCTNVHFQPYQFLWILCSVWMENDKGRVKGSWLEIRLIFGQLSPTPLSSFSIQTGDQCFIKKYKSLRPLVLPHPLHLIQLLPMNTLPHKFSMLIANNKTSTKSLFGWSEKWEDEKQMREYERK